MINPLLGKLRGNYIKLVCMPRNMAQLFQPLDLTINGSPKLQLKHWFTESHKARISDELDSGKKKLNCTSQY